MLRDLIGDIGVTLHKWSLRSPCIQCTSCVRLDMYHRFFARLIFWTYSEVLRSRVLKGMKSEPCEACLRPGFRVPDPRYIPNFETPFPGDRRDKTEV